MKIRTSGIFVVLALSACATAPPQTLAALETAFTASTKAATVYVELPLCKPGASLLCSTASTSASIKAAAAKAYAALVALRSNPTDLTLINAAQAGIAAYLASVPTTTNGASS